MLKLSLVLFSSSSPEGMVNARIAVSFWSALFKFKKKPKNIIIIFFFQFSAHFFLTLFLVIFNFLILPFPIIFSLNPSVAFAFAVVASCSVVSVHPIFPLPYQCQQTSTCLQMRKEEPVREQRKASTAKECRYRSSCGHYKI